MAGAKRSADDTAEIRTTRSSKVAKTDRESSPKHAKNEQKGGKRGPKTSLAPSAFKAKALPLHVNITHTPPVIPEDDVSVPSASADPGFIGSATLVPSKFATGSYGWKGSKRVSVNMPNPEGGEGEKVQVMITFNAVVMGSKQVKDTGSDGDDGKEADTAPSDEGVPGIASLGVED